MTSPFQANTSTRPPVFRVLRGNDLSAHLHKWLNATELEEVVLVSFGFDPTYRRDNATLTKKLELLSPDTDVTLITVLPTDWRHKGSRSRTHGQIITRLAGSGVRVLLHDTLHAKIYLFKRGDRVCWIVGSSNLTIGGLSHNTEVNLTGYRQEEYGQIVSEVNRIKEAAYPV